MKNNKILNMHHCNSDNIGDKSCCPATYFNISSKIIPINMGDKIDCNILIIGGGALLQSDKLNQILNYYTGKTIIVGWGLGHSFRGIYQTINYSKTNNIKLFNKLGVRDCNTGLRWVPCVSCMSKLFDIYRNMKPLYKYVFYQNYLTVSFNKLNLPGPLMSNNIKSMKEAVSFLASGEIIITSSYHGMYWGTLLGRKVIAIPFGSKFYGFKYRPILGIIQNIFKVNINKIPIYPDALTECRERNIEYAAEIIKMAK